MPSPYTFIQNALPQNQAQRIYAEVGAPAPTSFAAPLVLMSPDWSPDIPLTTVTQWPADHGSVLPSIGDTVLLEQDSRGIWRVASWGHATTTWGGITLPPSAPSGAGQSIVANGLGGSAWGFPGFGANWKGIWSAVTTYAVGDGVTGSDGHNYISLVAGNLNHNPVGDLGVHWSDLLPASYVSVASPDTGALAASRIAVAHEAPLNVEWPEYGAAPGHSAAANSTSLAAAVAALPASGGTIFLPRSYSYDTGLVLDDQRCATLQGVGGKSSGAGCASNLTYTGTGVALSCRSTSGTTLRDFALDAPSATANVIDFSHSGSGLDAAYMTLENLRLSAGASCPRILELDKSIIGRFSGLNFGGSPTRSVRGWAGGVGGYSNGHIFSGCTFIGTSNHPIDSPGSAYSFIGCVFEGKASGEAGGIQLNGAAQGLVVEGCWFGDASLGTGFWIDCEAASSGLSIRGNFFGGGATLDAVLLAVPGFKGVEIVGNDMDTCRYGVNIQALVFVDGLLIMNDDSNCRTSGINLAALPTRGIIMDGKAGTFGSYGMTVH